MTEQHNLAIENTVPTPLEVVEDWLVAECNRVLGSVFRSVDSGPGQWSDAYLARLVQSVPAVRVAFLNADARDPLATELDMDTNWAIYILTGWSGQREKVRRRGDNRGVGSYRAAGLLAPWVHNCLISGAGRAQVTGIANLWSGELDKRSISLVAISVTVPVSFDPQIDADAFANFLTAGVDWDLPDVGLDVDSEQLINMRE